MATNNKPKTISQLVRNIGTSPIGGRIANTVNTVSKALPSPMLQTGSTIAKNIFPKIFNQGTGKNTALVARVGDGLTPQQTTNAYSTIRKITGTQTPVIGPTPILGPKPPVNTSTGGSTTKTTTTNPNSSPTINDMGGASYGGGNYSPTAGANYGTTTGTNYGANTTGATGGMATAGDLVNGASYSDGLTNEERDLQRALQDRQKYLDEQRNQNTDENTVMNNVLQQFQGEIDATNRVYADKLAEAKITGRNRLGMDRAENFNAGATNSSFANASADRTMAYNDQQYSAIENEKLARIMAIQNNARTLGQKFLADKKASKEAGYSEYINNLNSTKTLKDNIVTKLATNILNSGIDINTIKGADLTKIAQDSGTTVDAIKGTYMALKKANDAAVAKAMKDGQFDLSEGESRYDINGNLIAKNNKTYKTTGGGTAGGSGTVGVGISNFPPSIQSAAQSIFDGKSKLNEYPSGQRLAINQAFSQLYTAEGGNDLAQGAYDALVKLENHKGLKGAVGAKTFSSLYGLKSKPMEGSQAASFLSTLEQLKANLKLVNIKYLKGTGAISDAEGKTLEDASTSLQTANTEQDFKTELSKVKAALVKANKIIGEKQVDTSNISLEEAQQLVDEGYATSIEDAYSQLNG